MTKVFRRGSGLNEAVASAAAENTVGLAVTPSRARAEA